MWENLKRTVNNAIKPNDNREITGEKHNNTLSAVINSLGKYSQFAGLAFKNTNPGTPDGPVFYFAAFKGVYLNFNRIEVKENEVAILNYNNNKWGKIVIGYSPIAPATAEDIRLTAFIDAVNDNNALKTNFEFKQDSILNVQIPFLHAAVSHIDADGQLIKGKPTSEVLIPVPLAEPSIDVDTPGKHGFMSYQDKDLLDSIPNYTISGKKISENPILTYDDIQGVAYLGEDGKIPSSLLPSYVDDVIEYDSIDYFPAIGESGKIYIDNKTNLAYRWSGTKYVSISSSIALGETSSTAYAGDKGKKNAEDIADLKTNKADKTSVYTKEEVDYLIEHFKLPDHIKAITFSVDGILLSKNENGDLVIGGNVVVEGGISMYGPGQFGDSIMDYIIVDNESIKIINGKLTVDPNFVGGGTVKGIKVNGYTYDEVDTNGYITIPDYPTELAWNSITGKPSTFTPSAHTHAIEDITDIANASVSHATTADRLKKEIKIWGQPFDGSTDVEGAISNVDVINMANADTVISLYIKGGVLFLEGDLAVTGGITMYASNGVASGMIDQVYAVLDPTIFSKQGDYITIKGDIGGGTVKAVKVGSTQYDPDSDGIISLPEYPTVTTLEWDNILNKPSSFIPSAHTHSSITIPVCSSLNGNSDVFSVEYAGGNNSVATKPSGVDAFGVIRLRTATGWSGQIMMSANTAPGIYYRNASDLTSSVGWKKLLDSGNFGDYAAAKSHTHAISEITNLQTILDGKAAASHTHSDYVTSLGTNGNYLTWTKNGSTSNITVPYATSATSADTSNRTKFLETFQQGSTTNTFGSSYPIWAQWSNGTNVRLKCTDYTVWTDKADYATSAGNADTVDGEHSSAFAHRGAHNNLMASDEFTFASSGFSGTIWINYRTAGGTNGNITGYVLGNGATGQLGYIIHTGNYNSYAPTLTGTGASGTWGISVSGNAATATKSAYSRSLLGRSTSGSDYGANADNLVFAEWNTMSDNRWYLKTTSYECRVAYANNADTLDGNHASAFAAASHTHSYLPLSGGTMDAGARISHADGNLYLGRADNNGWLMCQDMCSQSAAGDSYWSLRTDGTLHAVSGVFSSGITISGNLYVRGASIYCNNYLYIEAWPNYGSGSASAWYNGTEGTVKWNCNIFTSGGITMYSDLRKKNILSNEVLSVKEIAAAPLFRHTYKSDDNQYIHVGTSAQYWSGIHEDWFTRKDGEGYYQMELQNLGVAMGISLAREIVKYESKTDKKIRLMKKRINELEARVKELEERRIA